MPTTTTRTCAGSPRPTPTPPPQQCCGPVSSPPAWSRRAGDASPRGVELWTRCGPQRARLLAATHGDDLLRPDRRRCAGGVAHPPWGRCLARGTAAPVTARIDELLAEARAGLP